MSPQTLDRGTVRITLRLIGVPFTIVALLLGIDGIGIGFGGIDHGNGWAIAFGMGTILSYLGLAGAWWRLSVIYEKLSAPKVRLLRSLLIGGICGGFCLSAGVVGIFGKYGLVGALFFVLLSIGGVWLLNGTPKFY